MDEPTRQNISCFRRVFEKAQSTKRDYTALAAELQAKSNKLVSECKMNGKDHDMLHMGLQILSSLKEMRPGDPMKQKTGYHAIDG